MLWLRLLQNTTRSNHRGLTKKRQSAGRIVQHQCLESAAMRNCLQLTRDRCGCQQQTSASITRQVGFSQGLFQCHQGLAGNLSFCASPHYCQSFLLKLCEQRQKNIVRLRQQCNTDTRLLSSCSLVRPWKWTHLRYLSSGALQVSSRNGLRMSIQPLASNIRYTKPLFA